MNHFRENTLEFPWRDTFLVERGKIPHTKIHMARPSLPSKQEKVNQVRRFVSTMTVEGAGANLVQIVISSRDYLDFPLLLLLLLSAFPISQGWPQRIIILHIFLSSMSIFFTPTSFISSFTTSKNLLFCRPLLLFPGNSISIIILPTYSWSLLMTCPYHLSLPSLIFIPNRSTLTVLLMTFHYILKNCNDIQWN